MELRDAARYLREVEQMSLNDICEFLSKPKGTVYHWIRDLPKPPKKPRPKRAPAPPKIRPSPEDRFWAKVCKDTGPVHPELGRCWIWTASCFQGGSYGQFRVGNTVVGAHRFSLELHAGAIPEGLFACHKCDNPPCVNPAHIYAGTNLDNAQDAVVRGRSARGSRNGQSKLTEATIEYCRKNYVKGSHTLGARSLARRFGVSHDTITKALLGTTWKHVDVRSTN